MFQTHMWVFGYYFMKSTFDFFVFGNNWIKDLLILALPIKARLSFLHSQSLLSGRFHKPLS